MVEVLWIQGKGANALGSSQCEGEQVFIDDSCVVVFCMIMEHFSCLESSISSVLLG